MKIRYAIERDISDLLPLLSELGYPTSLENFRSRFNRFLQNSGYGVAVCEAEEKVLGCVAWSQSSIFVSEGQRFHIEGLIVLSTYRRQGIGKKLMEFVEEIARKNRPSLVDLTSGLRRKKEGSHEFYKSLGYKNEGYIAKVYLKKEV